MYDALTTVLDKQGGFTRKKYLQVCEQLGEDPDPSVMPMSLSDFPREVHEAIYLHGQLADRYATTDLGLLYIGKDYSTFPMFYKYAELLPEHETLILEIVQFIDAKAVKKSSEAHAKAAAKLKKRK